MIRFLTAVNGDQICYRSVTLLIYLNIRLVLSSVATIKIILRFIFVHGVNFAGFVAL